MKPNPDEFDFMSCKVMRAIVDTAHTLDNMGDPFRAGGITALEEVYFRISGKHFDWEEFKVAEAAAALAAAEPSAKEAK